MAIIPAHLMRSVAGGYDNEVRCFCWLDLILLFQVELFPFRLLLFPPSWVRFTSGFVPFVAPAAGRGPLQLLSGTHAVSSSQ